MGATMGFAATLINGGSLSNAFGSMLKGALFGAVSAGIANEIGNWAGGLESVGDGHSLSFFTKGSFAPALAKAAMHGIARGVIDTIQGGKFGAGFASGFVSSGFAVSQKWGTVESRTIVMAMVGGTTSQITGGKFANGAISGAFVHLFNSEGNKLIRDWLSGNGSRMRAYGPDSEMTQELKTDPAIRYYKEQFLNTYHDIGSAKYYPTEFGITDLLFANTNTLENIGSYGLSIYYTGSNELTMVVSNTMGFNSLTAGLLPNIQSGPMSSIETWFWWKEPIK